MRTLTFVAIGVAVLLSACNAILDNEPRHLRAEAMRADGGGVDAGRPADAGGYHDAGADATDAANDARVDDAGDASADAADAAEPVDAAVDGGCAARPHATCEPGDTADETVACGPCGSGAKVVTRTCTKACKWSAPSEADCEYDPDRCEADSVETRPDACGLCSLGTSTSTRTCSAECNWGDWVASTCAGVPDTACQPGTGTSQNVACNPSFCNKGVQAQISTCTEQCTWGEWVNSGDCVVNKEIFCQPLNLGGNPPYQCCGINQWQFCWDQGTAFECTWSTDCETCTDVCGCG